MFTVSDIPLFLFAIALWWMFWGAAVFIAMRRGARFRDWLITAGLLAPIAPLLALTANHPRPVPWRIAIIAPFAVAAILMLASRPSVTVTHDPAIRLSNRGLFPIEDVQVRCFPSRVRFANGDTADQPLVAVNGPDFQSERLKRGASADIECAPLIRLFIKPDNNEKIVEARDPKRVGPLYLRYRPGHLKVSEAAPGPGYTEIPLDTADLSILVKFRRAVLGTEQNQEFKFFLKPGGKAAASEEHDLGFSVSSAIMNYEQNK